TLTVVGSSDAPGGGIAVDDANVYWIAGDDPATINSAPKAGGSSGAPLVAGQHHPIAVAVDAVRMYWVNAYVGIGATDGTVMACTFGSCGTPMVLAGKQRDPVSIAIDEAAIYWANNDFGGGAGAIMKLAKP